MFEVNFIENNYEEESEVIENDLYFLMNYLRMNAIILMRRHMLEILILEAPLKKKIWFEYLQFQLANQWYIAWEYNLRTFDGPTFENWLQMISNENYRLDLG